MKFNELVVRCFAEKKANYGQAFCIDLCLAAQGDTREEVIQKLNDQIKNYLWDIFEGEDRGYASQLLSRKSPLSIQMKYYLLYIRKLFTLAWQSLICSKKAAIDSVKIDVFKNTMPLHLAKAV